MNNRSLNSFLEVDVNNVQNYLHDKRRLQPEETATVELLAWGVSNVVLRVTTSTGSEFVLKQSSEQLRTEVLWKSRLDRIYRECDVMRTVVEFLPAAAVPQILFEDRENYLFAMQAVAADHIIWKADLLNGNIDPAIAASAGDILSAIHFHTADDNTCQTRYADREVFVQLRVDPFYRYIARAHPQLQPAIEELITEMWQTTLCVVHADFSPKNILISELGVTLVDYETAHYGDPAFDIGFFLSHLLLKSVLHAERADELLQLCTTFWEHYIAGLGELRSHPKWNSMALERRSVQHLAACMLSRIEGTSTVDYLTKPDQQQQVLTYCYALFNEPVLSFEDAFHHLHP